MRLGARVAVAMAVAALAAAAAGARPAPPSARAFVEQVYARYARSDDPCLTCEDTRALVFDASLAALIARDEGISDAELGPFSEDWVCQCEDPSGLKAQLLSVKPNGANEALAEVAVHLPSIDNRVTLKLRLERGGWRIDDALFEGKSYRAELKEDIARPQ